MSEKPTPASIDEAPTEAPTGDELPMFPATAPAVLQDPASAAALITPVLDRLATVVDVDPSQLGLSTPCAGFDVSQLRQHVVGWLGFFAAALADPDASTERPDPEADPAPDADPAAAVRSAAAMIASAIEAGVADRVVTMMQARMNGGAVLAMLLGEYLVHGWDLASATGRPWPVDTAAAAPALEFLESTVAPEYRGPDSGFFDAEVEPPADADDFVRLLCFSGRAPTWQPS